MVKRKWTKEIRLSLYQCLVDRFGPYYTWEKASYPKDKKEEFDKFLGNFATAVSVLSGQETTSEAVYQQMAWALTSQEAVNYQSDQFILNMAAAYETGFIRSKDLPSVLLVERKKIV